MDPKQAEAQFQETLDRVLTGKVEVENPEITDLSKFQSPLGRLLQRRFEEAERDRRGIEQEWIRDLRQFKGQYDPEILSQMHPKRSKAYLSVTRTKVKTISARVSDILFPANGDRNWSISPTPVPELDPMLMQQIANQMLQLNGKPPTEPEIRNVVVDEAKRRSDAMQREIEDQLNEVRYREIIRQVIHSGNLYGTGILKGPLVKRNVSKRWVTSPDGSWNVLKIETLSPFCENVSLWDIYPDMSVTNVEDAEYLFQRHVMPRHRLVGLGKRPGFNMEAILEYLKAYKEGDSEYRNYENDLSDLSRDAESKPVTSFRRANKYDVLEYWGYLNVDHLRDEGVEIGDDVVGPEVAANVWVLGDVVIKAVISPLEGVNFPYHFYYFEKDETSIFGEGIPRIMRDPQRLFNASVRAMLDNAANSAGPYIEANTELLAPDEDPTDLYPFRVFQRLGQGVEASAKAINVYDIPSHTGELLRMTEFFLNSADEITTVPRYMYGDTQAMSKGAGQTATGLSMLMGAANITIKDQIKNFDDGVTKRFIKAMYYWNMDFNQKQDIKGDFCIKAEGSSSLVAKEVLVEQLNQWLQLTANGIDLQYVNRDVALREAAKAMDLDGLQLVKNSDQVKFEQDQASQAQQAESERMYQLELMKAKSSGHVGDDGQTKERATMERLDPQALQQGAIPEVTGPDGRIV